MVVRYHFKKIFSCLVVAAMIFSVALTVSSCEIFEETFIIRFDSKGGTPTPQEQTVKKGGKIEKPTDPTRENYTLTGWARADSETSALWNFDTETVSEDMTLFARWSINTYTVTFDSNGGSTVATQNVAHGGVANKPTDPTRDGHEFDGWFNGSTEWNFVAVITAPITLKAQWTAVHAVTFDSEGVSAVTVQNIRDGGTATQPEDPTRDGYEFDGWFNGDTEWNFATAITAPITLTAKWTKLHTVTFDSDGGSAVTVQTIRNGNTVTKPADPTKAWVATAGLYLGTPPSTGNYTFNGWYNDEALWDFDNDAVTENITLKAQWTADFSLTRIESVPANDVAAAFTYANANSTGVEEYALLLDANVMATTQSLNSANVKLTIIGIGAERFITVTSSNGRLFSIDGNNVNLTLGRNITLMGKSGNSTHFIHVQRGNITMLDGSKITGFRTPQGYYVVLVEGTNASFKIEGGEIRGNDGGSGYNGGKVYVRAGATFEISGGSITGNSTNWMADLYIDDANCTFLLSGSAILGVLHLTANNNTTRATVTIGNNYSGTVTTLHLGGGGNTESVSTITSYWTNAPVIVNGTASVISMFNNGGLGNFRNKTTGSTQTGTSIRATHELNPAGVLVLK